MPKTILRYLPLEQTTQTFEVEGKGIFFIL